MGKPANYEVVYEQCTDEFLVIRDVGPWDAHFTVTNDAETVVMELHRVGQLPPGRRLFYYDSEGDLDELEHDGYGIFTGFKHVPALPDDLPDSDPLKGWMKP